MKFSVSCHAFFLLWLLLSVRDVHCQSPAMRYYTSELAGPTVYSIVQDRRGFMWFGTGDGVTRFDGVDSKHYGMAEGLRNEFVITMAEAPDGSMLLGTWGDGLYRLADGICSRYPSFQNQLPQKIKFLLYDRSNRLWVGNPAGMGYVINNRYTVLDFGLPPETYELYDICERRNGDILISTTYGIFCLSHGTLRHQYVMPVPHKPYRSLAESPDGTLWCSSDGMLYTITGDTLLPVHQTSVSGSEAVSLLRSDSRGRLWGAGLQAGTIVWDNGARRLLALLRQFEKVHVNALCEDTEGNMWLGTYGMGAVMVAGFRGISYTTDDGLSSSYVLDICGNGPDGVILGTRDGANIIDSGRVRRIALPSAGDIPFLYVPALVYDTTGILWMSVGTTLVRRLRDGRIIPSKAMADIGGLVRILYRDRSGTLWVYSRSIVVNRLLYEHKGRFFRWRRPPPLENLRISALADDHTGTFWIATDSGAFACRNGAYRHYTTADGLPSNMIYDIVETRDGLWLATAAGLTRLTGGHWFSYTRRDGLSNNKCLALLADSLGALWIGTQNGLNRFADGTFTVYDKEDGLIANEINTLYTDGRNVVWVGTAKGVTKLYINEPDPPVQTLPMYITGVHAADETVALSGNAELPHTRNSLHFSFTGISYRRSGDVSYRYIIAGIDRQWQHTTLRSVRYSSLPPGQYTFLVQARSRYGPWSRSASFSFVIRPAFWETWWFRALLVLGSGVTLVLAARWQVHRAKRKEIEHLAAQYRVLQLEQKALQALMNPHFVFNALNSIHRYIRTGDETQAGDYLAQFARLIRMTFENAQNTWVVLEEELRRLELYLSLEQLRFGNRLTYNLVVDATLDVADIQVPSMILQPYVENAILHGITPRSEGGHITVAVQHKGEQLLLIVEDDGIGIEAARADKQQRQANGHHSSGMMLTEERLRLLSRLARMDITLHISERPADERGHRGTRVEIVLPFNLADVAE